MNQENGGAYTISDKARLRMVADMCKGGVSVLDVGCGPSEIMKCLLGSFYTYIGIDIAPGEKNTYGDIYNFDTTDKFDVVLLLEVLEHLERPLEALENIHDMVKDTGKLIISVPNPYNLDQIASVVHNNTNIENVNHINLFGDNEIRSLCHHSGFKKVVPSRFYTKIPGLNWLSPVRSRFGEWNIYEVYP